MADTAPRRRTQEERKAESERQIIRAAIRIFARQGYLRTTLNQVGEEAGYTGGLVSHRFGSKAGLLKAVITDSGNRFLQDQIGASLERESAGLLITGLLRGVVMQYLFDREAFDITRMVPQVQLAALGSLR